MNKKRLINLLMTSYLLLGSMVNVPINVEAEETGKKHLHENKNTGDLNLIHNPIVINHTETHASNDYENGENININGKNNIENTMDFFNFDTLIVSQTGENVNDSVSVSVDMKKENDIPRLIATFLNESTKEKMHIPIEENNDGPQIKGTWLINEEISEGEWVLNSLLLEDKELLVADLLKNDLKQYTFLVEPEVNQGSINKKGSEVNYATSKLNKSIDEKIE